MTGYLPDSPWPCPAFPPTVWIADLRRLGAAAERLAMLLSPEEQSRSLRFVHAADRRRFVTGRALARLAAASCLSCGPRDVAIVLEPGGRPGLDAGAASPSLSIAHAGELVAVALAARAAIGIDVEPIDRQLDLDGLAPLVCSEAESHAIRGLDPAARRERLLHLWTLKEACLKATGHGLSIEPREVVFEFRGDASPVLTNHPHASGPTRDVPHWSFVLLPDCAGHVLAVAQHWAPGDAPVAAPVIGAADRLLAPVLASQ